MTMEILLRNATASDFDAILALNESEVEHTSPMDVERLRFLDSLSGYHQVAVVDGVVAGFLLAMKNSCEYRNDNFEWFASRYDSFIYVDRIVISKKFHGLKLGTMLYMDLFTFAKANSITVIACEYNIVPANEPSRHFHEKFSFKQVGNQWLNNHSKQVSMQIAVI